MASQSRSRGQPYLQKAVGAADQLLAPSSPFRLVATGQYADIFYKKNSQESIFEVQFDVARNELQGDGGSNSPYALTAYAPFAPFNRFSISEKFVAAAEAGDARIAALTFAFNSSLPIYTKYKGTPTGNQEITYGDANLFIYRLADIILLKAEALNDLGQTNLAIPLINQIRNRAGLINTTASTPDQVRDAILKERYIELHAEGKRWFDLIRNNVVTREIPGVKGSEHILWPIHESVINENPNIIQNTYYK